MKKWITKKFKSGLLLVAGNSNTCFKVDLERDTERDTSIWIIVGRGRQSLFAGCNLFLCFKKMGEVTIGQLGVQVRINSINTWTNVNKKEREEEGSQK